MPSPIRLDRLSSWEDRLRQAGYQQLEPFFVLREGAIKDERSGGVVQLDRNRLQLIAAIQNNRIAETGDFTPIIVGHTKRNKAETEQPPIVGKASRFEVAPFYETGTWGLRAVPWSKPQNLEIFDKFPRRSAELWTNPDLLDPISLLGANTPRLDLGLHRLQRDDAGGIEYYTPTHGRSGAPIYLELEMPNDKDPPSSADKDADGKGGGNGGGGGGGGGGDKGGAVTFNSPEWQQMTTMVQQMHDALMPILQEIQGGGAPAPGGPPGAVLPGGPPGGGMPPPGPPGGGGMPPPGGPEPSGLQQMSGHPMPYGGHPMNLGHPMHAGHPAQHAGHPGMALPPGGGGEQMQHMTHPMQHAGHPHMGHPQGHHLGTPTLSQFNLGGGTPAGGTNAMMPTQLSREAVQHTDPQIIAYIQQMQQQLNALTHQNAQLQLSMIQEHVNTTLDDLEGKVTIDRPRDFERLVRLSRADFDAEVQFMLATRKPIEQPNPLAAGVPLHLQAGVGTAGKGNAGPMQLSLSQAHDLIGVPADPQLAAQAAGPASGYDHLMDIVRNRGKGESAMDAYEKYKTMTRQQLNGTPTVRG